MPRCTGIRPLAKLHRGEQSDHKNARKTQASRRGTGWNGRIGVLSDAAIARQVCLFFVSSDFKVCVFHQASSETR